MRTAKCQWEVNSWSDSQCYFPPSLCLKLTPSPVKGGPVSSGAFELTLTAFNHQYLALHTRKKNPHRIPLSGLSAALGLFAYESLDTGTQIALDVLGWDESRRDLVSTSHSANINWLADRKALHCLVIYFPFFDTNNIFKNNFFTPRKVFREINKNFLLIKNNLMQFPFDKTVTFSGF